jgi:hypothetical protein
MANDIVCWARLCLSPQFDSSVAFRLDGDRCCTLTAVSISGVVMTSES